LLASIHSSIKLQHTLTTHIFHRVLPSPLWPPSLSLLH
jgi:hypothetical protein